MLRRLALIAAAGALLAGCAAARKRQDGLDPDLLVGCQGRTLDRASCALPSVQRSAITFAPPIARASTPAMCCKSGGSVKVIFYGFGSDILTSFTYTRRDCG